jgi:hypothetical protein
VDSAQPDHLGVLALAVGCLLPALATGWKAASWRGDVFNKWSERVEFAHAGLNERANSELVALQVAISEALGGATGFTPAEVSADPDPLVASANRCANLLRARDRLRGRFQRYRQLGPILIPTVAAYLLGWLAATLYFTEVIHRSWAKIVGFALGGLAVVVALAIFCLYAYFEAKLTAAEEMAAGERG